MLATDIIMLAKSKHFELTRTGAAAPHHFLVCLF